MTVKKPEPREKQTMSQIIPKRILLQRISEKSIESFPKLCYRLRTFVNQSSKLVFFGFQLILKLEKPQ